MKRWVLILATLTALFLKRKEVIWSVEESTVLDCEDPQAHFHCEVYFIPESKRKDWRCRLHGSGPPAKPLVTGSGQAL